MLYPLTTGGKMALQELVIVNPGRKSRRSTTKTRKVKNMARRRTTRRKAAPKRRATTRRRKTTKRRAAPKRRKTTRRRKTTKRRAAPKRRRTTRRKTTRRRKSPARRRTTRRRKVSRRRTTRSRKMSMKGLYNFVVKNMTAFEAIAALGVGLVSGIKLPALAEKAFEKVMGRKSPDLTSGWRGPLVGAALTGALGYALYGMKLVNFNVASTIALAGATVGMMNLASNYFNLPLPGFATIGGFGGLLGGSNTLHDNVSAFGYLGEAPFEPFGMGHEGSAGYHDMGRVVNVF